MSMLLTYQQMGLNEDNQYLNLEKWKEKIEIWENRKWDKIREKDLKGWILFNFYLPQGIPQDQYLL